MFFATVHMKHHNYKVNKETRHKGHVTIINNDKINNETWNGTRKVNERVREAMK